MVGHGAKFSRKKEAAINALVTQRTIGEAARVAGIGTQTLHRWLKLPEFQAAYREARRSTFGQSTARMQQASGAAASTLIKTMIDPTVPASIRIRAAQSILEHGRHGFEMEDLEVRIGALEEASERSKPGGTR